MKEKFEDLLQKGVEEKDVHYFGKHISEVCREFGVLPRLVYVRFKSMYGKGPREVILDRLKPEREELEEAILSSENSNEFHQKIKLPTRYKSGIFDREFGVGTFQKAKLKLLAEKPAPVRSRVFREDNVSLCMSQYLGDGGYYRKRHALRIDHGIKQLGYLRWKVALFKEAFPFVPTKITEYRHTQGHMMASWWSRRLGKVEFPEDKREAVKLLTPIGWLLWYLDDGGWWQDIQIACKDDALKEVACEELGTYGIKSRVVTNQSIVMAGQEQSLAFYKNFIEPYKDLIPLCMKYKVELKI